MIDPPSTLGVPLSGSRLGIEPGWTDGRIIGWLRLFLTLGVVLRLVRFALNHPLWRDETFLAANLVDRDFEGLTRPLDYGQVCPILFLWAEKGISLVFGFNERSLRLLPTVASIAGLPLFRHLAGRLLQGQALVLAVAILAVGYTPIRHGGEIKPYSTDFFAALGLITLAVEWLRAPDRVGFLWGLAAVAPLALGLSNPAIFVVGSLSLVLAIPVLKTRSLSAIIPFGLFGVGGAATFLVLLRWINAPQSGNVMAWMQVYWVNAFPPRLPAALLGWLVQVHTSHMFAYPAGGDHGSSTLTTVLVVVAIMAYLRRGSKTVLAVLLTPFALGMIAAILGRYPYGGSARTMQYVAPAIILMAGLGASVLLNRLPRPLGRERASRFVLSVLFASGLGMMAWDLSRPYKTIEDQTARDFARRFWAEEAPGAELLCARNDLKLKLNPLVWEGERAALYLCYQAIYRGGSGENASTRLDRVSDAHPLRVVVFGEVAGDASTLARWMAENEGRFRLKSRRERVLNPGLFQGKALVEDRYFVYELIPSHPSQKGRAMPTPETPRVGDVAPDFALDDGQAMHLADFRGRAEVVLFFYPKDNTPGCTAQACSFRDDYAAFRQRGAEVVGISGDSGESHQSFADRHQLPYRLVTDGDGSIRRRYGIKKTWGLIPGRVSVLVDRDGVIRRIHESQFRPTSHVPAMLDALQQVQSGRG